MDSMTMKFGVEIRLVRRSNWFEADCENVV